MKNQEKDFDQMGDLKVTDALSPMARRIIALQRDHQSYSLGDHPKDVETPDPVSMTTPGMALTLPDLIERFVRGQEIPLQSDPYFHEDLPDVDKMDKVERELYGREVRQKIADAQAVLAQAKEKSQRMRIEDQAKEIEKLKNPPKEE